MILNSDHVFSEMPNQPVMNRVGTIFIRILIYSSFNHCPPQKTQENVASSACKSCQAVIPSQEKHLEVLLIHQAAIFPLWQY